MPTATLTPEGVELLDGRYPGTCVVIAARTGDEGRPERCQTRQIRRGQLHAVNGEHARTKKPVPVKVLNRTHARRHPGRIPGANLFEQHAPCALAASR